MKLKNSIKVITVIGTRPELIKMSAIIKKFDQFFHHIFVHTGQNFDEALNDIFYQDLDLRIPDYNLAVSGKNSIESISSILVKIDKVLEKEKPDAFVIYGDTNSCLSVIAAKKRKIPVFHLEAGNRCFNENVPEEINRRLVDRS